MSNFTPSNFLKAQALLLDKYKAPEMRMRIHPVTSLGLKNQSSVIPDYQMHRTREDRSVSGYLAIRNRRSVITSRTHNHTGNRGDSAEQAFTWSTFGDKFSISKKQLDNNILSFDSMLANQLEQAMKNIIEGIETSTTTALLAAKTQVNVATNLGTYNGATDTFEITGASQFYQYLKSMMNQNSYRGELDIIANNFAYSNAEFQRSQGAGNATNTNFQFLGMNIAESNELTDVNYTADLCLAMPQGSFALLPWIPKQNRQGDGDYNSVLGGYGSMTDPFGLGIDFAVHAYTERADTSASNGNTQDDLINFELSVDIANAISPLSVATETPIFQVARV